jgi:hypothetical protein
MTRRCFSMLLAAGTAWPGDAPSRLEAGLESAIRLFQSFAMAYDRLVVDPLVRAQSLRAMTAFSERLTKLSFAKSDLTEELKVSGDNAALKKKAAALRDEVRQVRELLVALFKPLPESWQARAATVKDALESGLTEKSQSLTVILSELNLPNRQEAAAAESERTVEKIKALRQVVDNLIREKSR